MAIYSLMIACQNPNTKQICIVQRNYKLDKVSWAMRSQAKNTFKFVVRESLPCVSKYTRHTVKQDDKLCYIQVSKKPVAAYAFVDQDYPQRVIFGLLNKTLQIFFEKVGQKWQTFTQDQSLDIKQIGVQFQKFQDPKNADKVTKAIDQVEKTKVVLHQSVKKLLERQGDLDDLVDKSKDLSAASKQFYQTSKKMDKSCCQLI